MFLVKNIAIGNKKIEIWDLSLKFEKGLIVSDYLNIRFVRHFGRKIVKIESFGKIENTHNQAKKLSN